MNQYFNIKLEFDRHEIDRIVDSTIRSGSKGYVCAVNANIVAIADEDPSFRKVVNRAVVNVCDGSILAIALTIINRRRFEPYPGPDLFIDYITSHQDCNHFFLGSDGLTLKGLRDYVTALNPHIKASAFLPLPYKSDPRDFDYREIANMVDREQADIIWVSLGAPKQEQFMYYLVRHLRRGVMFGVGAAFSFYSGGPGVRRAPRLLRSLKLEWFYRVCREPNRLTYRFYRELRTMTKLCLRELAKTC